jgi:hypothetical protein
MAEKELLDSSGHLIGKIYFKSDGTQELIGKDGHLKGRYFPNSDETIDASGHLAGRGNLLAMLL